MLHNGIRGKTSLHGVAGLGPVVGPHARSPLLDSLQQLLIFLELGSPELDTALQMGPH